MNVLNTVNQIVLIVGLPAIIAAAIYIGRKLQILDNLQESSEKIKHNLALCSHALIKKNFLDGSKLRND